MNSNILILAGLSYFIGFLFLLLIRSYDKYDKEPLGRLVLFSFLGGIVSILVSTLLYVFIHPKFNLTDAILKVGTVEEFSKLATLFILYPLIRKEFDEIVDGIIYAAAIALGFSVIENIFYAINADFSYSLLFKRFFFATIGHISFSVYLGIAFYVHKKVHQNYLGLLLAFILATLAHGLYDGFIFNRYLTALFLPIYVLLIYFQFRLLKVAYAYSRMKAGLSISNLKFNKNDDSLQCCHCNDTNTKLYDFNGIKIHICQTCDRGILHKTDFEKLLKFYRPKLNRKIFIKSVDKPVEKLYLDSENSIEYYPKKQRLNAHLFLINAWFNKENRRDLARYHKSMEGRLFEQLGFKYL